MPKINLLFALFFTQLVLACSPHPASGQWHNIATGNSNSRINMIDVMFDGKAEMYGVDKQQIIRRCFWAGQDSKTIALTCVHPDDTDTDIKYQLQVSSARASLIQADQVIANFRRQ